MAKTWTKEEEEYLEESWGEFSVGTIAKNLEKTENSVIVKKTRMGLGAFLESGDYVSYSQLLSAVFGLDVGSAYRVNKSWTNFPVKHKRVKNERFRVVNIDDFWKWAKKNKRKIDFSKMEENILGAEPEWVKKKRKIDFECRMKTSPWTKAEDLKLERMLEKNQYTYTDLSDEFNRTEDAIRRRIYDLAIGIKPVRAKNKKWTKGEVEKLKILYEEGWSIEKIGQKLGRTGQSVRGKIGLLKNPEQYLRKNRRRVG